MSLRERTHLDDLAVLDEIPQVSDLYPAAWLAVLDSCVEKPSYIEQLELVDKKLLEMGRLVSRNLNQLIRVLGGEGDKLDRQIFEMVSRGIEDSLLAYTLTAGNLESRARSMTTALGRAISFYPANIADIFAGFTPVFGTTNEDEVVLKETNIKGFALKQEWMIGLALKRREEGLPPISEAELVGEVARTLQTHSFNRATLSV